MIKVILSDTEKKLFDEDAKKVTISTNDGEITILRGHEQLMTTIKAGQIIIEKEDSTKQIFSVYNGVINVENVKGETRVVVLVENTENLNNLDEKVLEEAISSAEKANKEKQDENLNLDSGILRDMNKLKLKRRYTI